MPGFLTRILNSYDESRSDTVCASANERFLRGDDDEPESTFAGVRVDENTALTLTSVYACVDIISSAIAMLPLPVYKRLKPRGKEKAYGHRIYKLLHDTPNPIQTSFKWRQLTAIHQNLWGAGISEIEFDHDGYPVALWPLPPWHVTPKMTESKSVYYELRLDNNRKRNIPAHKTLVFSAFSASAYAWRSPIATNRETIGAALAVKEFGALTFGQGTNPAGVMTKPAAGLDEQSEQDLRKDLQKYKGLGRSHRVMLLEEGMKFERIGLPPEDAQYLQTRRFDISEIARMYHVPLYMLADHEKQTSWGTGLEEQKNGFVNFTLMPYLVQWEQEFKRRLFDGDDEYFAEFALSGLLRGTLADRYAAYVQGITNGILSPNECRNYENLNPYTGGDVYLAPLNMQSMQDIVKQVSENKE